MKTLASASITGFVQSSHMDTGSILLAGLTIYMENAVAIRPNDLVVVDAHLDESGAWRGRLEKHLHNPVLERAASPMASALRPTGDHTHPQRQAPADAPARSEIGARATAPPAPVVAAAPLQAAAPVQAPAPAVTSRAARFATARATPTGNSSRPVAASQQPHPAATAAPRPVFSADDDIDGDIPF